MCERQAVSRRENGYFLSAIFLSNFRQAIAVHCLFWLCKTNQTCARSILQDFIFMRRHLVRKGNLNPTKNMCSGPLSVYQNAEAAPRMMFTNALLSSGLSSTCFGACLRYKKTNLLAVWSTSPRFSPCRLFSAKT